MGCVLRCNMGYILGYYGMCVGVIWDVCWGNMVCVGSNIGCVLGSNMGPVLGRNI